jgi:hypothetical protein
VLLDETKGFWLVREVPVLHVGCSDCILFRQMPDQYLRLGHHHFLILSVSLFIQ